MFNKGKNDKGILLVSIPTIVVFVFLMLLVACQPETSLEGQDFTSSEEAVSADNISEEPDKEGLVQGNDVVLSSDNIGSFEESVDENQIENQDEEIKIDEEIIEDLENDGVEDMEEAKSKDQETVDDQVLEDDVSQAKTEDTDKAEDTDKTGDTEVPNEKDKALSDNESMSTSTSNVVTEATRIICWGDSLTYGIGGNGVSYPAVLAGLSGLEVINYGFSGETAEQIAYRQATMDLEVDAGDINIIFSGTNGGAFADRIAGVIVTQQSMIPNFGSDHYIVIGLPFGYGLDEVNISLQAAYGNRFLDWRTYLLTNGMEDAGLPITEGDQEDINNGIVPRSLRSDQVHGNSTYYELLGKFVYKKLKELGYL